MTRRQRAIQRLDAFVELAAEHERLANWPRDIRERDRLRRLARLEDFERRHPSAGLFTAAVFRDLLTVAKGEP